MNLDVASALIDVESFNGLGIEKSAFEKEKNFYRWIEHPSSEIIHHDSHCCEEAKLWFMAYAQSMQIGSLSQFQLNAPFWLIDLFKWGPSKWPISWCEVVREKVVDCGVFSALAREVFKAQGHEVHPAQALLSYNKTCTNHWKELWKAGFEDGKKKSFPWIGDEIVYHEILVLEKDDGSGRFYDSTFGQWYEPGARTGFGALLAVRSECPRILQWGNKQISCGEWSDL
jgi:hypothetical protein